MLGILCARVTKDANENIHPVSLSHFLAAEGDLSVGAHIAAEKDLLGDEVMNAPQNLTICDRSRCLEGCQARQLPNVSVLTCYRHLSQVACKARHAHCHARVSGRLPVPVPVPVRVCVPTCSLKPTHTQELLTSPAGRDSSEVYDLMALLPQCENAVIVADQLMQRLPPNSPLHKVKKSSLCAAYLPAKVCTHGNRTNGMVEVYNGMALPMRHQETPFRSLQARSLPLTPTYSHSPHLTPSHSTSPHLTPPHPTSLPLTPPHSHPLPWQATVSLLSRRQSSLPRLKVSETSDTLATAPLVRDLEAKERQGATSLGPPTSHEDPNAPTCRVFFVDSAAGGALSSAAGHRSLHRIPVILYTIPCYTMPYHAIPYHPLLPQELRFSEVGSSGKSHFKRSLKRIGDVLAVVGALRPLRLQGANTSREW